MAKTYNQIIYETEIAAELKALCIVYEYVGYERQMSLVFMCPPPFPQVDIIGAMMIDWR